MFNKKILASYDIWALLAVLLIYGCASANNENTVDWSNINYSKIACSDKNGEQDKECLAMKKDMSTVTVGGKR